MGRVVLANPEKNFFSWFFDFFFQPKYVILGFLANDAIQRICRQNTGNTSFGQKQKNRKIALIFMFLVRFFCCKKKNVIWDISDGLERFWGQKSFSTIFKITYYVNIAFSSIFFEQNLLETWPLARSGCPKIAKISKIVFFAKTCL